MPLTRAELYEKANELKHLECLPDAYVGWLPKGKTKDGIQKWVPYISYEATLGIFDYYFGVHYSLVMTPYPTCIQCAVSVIDADGMVLMKHADLSDIKLDKAKPKDDPTKPKDEKEEYEFADSDASAASRAFPRVARYYSTAIADLWGIGTKVQVSCPSDYGKPTKAISWEYLVKMYNTKGTAFLHLK